MKAQLTFRGRTMKQVFVDEISADDTDEAVLDLALAEAGETRDRLHGWAIHRYTVDITGARRAVATLYTD
jgi:hypothetical protein